MSTQHTHACLMQEGSYVLKKGKVLLPHSNDVVLSQLMDVGDVSVSHWMASFACTNVVKSTSNDVGVICTHCHISACCTLSHMDVVDVHATNGLLEHA